VCAIKISFVLGVEFIGVFLSAQCHPRKGSKHPTDQPPTKELNVRLGRWKVQDPSPDSPNPMPSLAPSPTVRPARGELLLRVYVASRASLFRYGSCSD
jgi:hypothetical protein